jgi:hypothetical protein
MYSIQEMLSKTEQQRKQIEDWVDSHNTFHPLDASIFTGLNHADTFELYESIHNTPLKEFIGKGGPQGADYLAFDKIHDTMISASRVYDQVPLMSAYMVEGWKGADLKVPIAKDSSYKALGFQAGGAVGQGIETVLQATLTPKSLSCRIDIGNDLVEDNAFDLIEWQLANFGKAIGYAATRAAIDVLLAAPDGDGTKGASATGDAGNTKWTGGATASVDTAMISLATNDWKANTLLTTGTCLGDSILGTAANIQRMAPLPGFDFKLDILDVLINNSGSMTSAASKLMTCIFDRNNALLTGRKRWLQLENMNCPRRDLSELNVSARQDSVSLYKDSIYVLTET